MADRQKMFSPKDGERVWELKKNNNIEVRTVAMGLPSETGKEVEIKHCGYQTCTGFEMNTVTWHWVFGDPLGARVQRVERCAHLLAVWHLAAGRHGEQLEEGAQKERAVDGWTRHGRQPHSFEQNHLRWTSAQLKLQEHPVLAPRWNCSSRISSSQHPSALFSFLKSPSARHSARPESCAPRWWYSGAGELQSPSSVAALTLSSMHRWTSPGHMRARHSVNPRDPPLRV